VIGALVLLGLAAITILKGGALKKLVTNLVLVAVGLTFVAAASAKGPVEAEICAQSDCVALDSRVGRMLIVDAGDRASRIHLYLPSQRLMAADAELPGALAWFPVVGEPRSSGLSTSSIRTQDRLPGRDHSRMRWSRGRVPHHWRLASVRARRLRDPRAHFGGRLRAPCPAAAGPSGVTKLF
jgi:hypothetical protein